MMSDGVLDITPLITHRYTFQDALLAYEKLNDPQALGVVLGYKTEYQKKDIRNIVIRDFETKAPEDAVICGFLGGGNYASRVLIPAFSKAHAYLDTIVTSMGLNSRVQGEKHGFNLASPLRVVFFDSDRINTVIIATQHHLHARLR